MKTILTPTDFSLNATQALCTTAAIAKLTESEIILMHNVETLFTRWEALSASEQQKHPEVLNQITDAFIRLNKLVESGCLQNVKVTRQITCGVTSDEIVTKAEQVNADMIVMGANGATGRDFIGSNVQKVMREANCPVLTLRKEQENQQWKKLVFPDTFDFDISVPFEKIKRIALSLGSTIKLLYINTPQNFCDNETVVNRMTSFGKKYPQLKFEFAIYSHTDRDRGILKFIEKDKADYIAMISYNHKHHPKYLLSGTDAIVYRASVPVLTATVNSAAVEETKSREMVGTA